MVWGKTWVCRRCGHSFVTDWSVPAGSVLLHCDTCGVGKELDHSDIGTADPEEVRRALSSWLWQRKLHCECGGKFDLGAPLRCPHCRSAELDHDPSTILGLEIGPAEA